MPGSTRRLPAGVAMAAALLAGCTTSVGPRALPRARFDYNQAVARSWNQQLLLNLVRLRYRDTMQFLEVSSVLAQYEAGGRAGVGAELPSGGDDLVTADAGVAYSERPTIAYTPLQGEDFVTRLLTPITPDTIVLLSQSGWSIERLMLCCVQQVNDVLNAPSAAGPTPTYEPEWREFRELAARLRRLQVARGLEVRVRREGGEDRTYLMVRRHRLEEGDLDRDLRQALETLGLPPEVDAFPITATGLDPRPGEIALRGRSLLGVLFYLSQGVEAPAADEEEGRVTVTRRPGGERFEWRELTAGLLRVSVGTEPPADAFVRVRYRGYWFYIDDRDLDSKTTFGLLSYLFSLQSAGQRGASPLVTVSAGG